MRHPLLLLAIVLIFTACGGPGGKANPEIVGQWKASDTYGGDTWTFRADGTFTAEGGKQRSLTGSSAMVDNLTRTGRWGEKDGVLMLEYAALTTREKPSFQWKKDGGQLSLTRPGESAPSYVLDRAN